MDQQNGIINPAAGVVAPAAAAVAQPAAAAAPTMLRRPMMRRDGTEMPADSPMAVENTQYQEAWNTPPADLLPKNPPLSTNDPATLQEAVAAAGNPVPGVTAGARPAPSPLQMQQGAIDQAAVNQQAYSDGWINGDVAAPAVTDAEAAANAKAPVNVGDRQIAGGVPVPAHGAPMNRLETEAIEGGNGQ